MRKFEFTVTSDFHLSNLSSMRIQDTVKPTNRQFICYPAMKIKNTKTGKWVARCFTKFYKNYGKRIVSIVAQHDDFEDEKFQDWEYFGILDIDHGPICLFDSKLLYSYENKVDYISSNCLSILDTESVDSYKNLGIVLQTGECGLSTVFVVRRQEGIIALKIDFEK